MAKKYRITYLPFFYKDLDAITNYIIKKLNNTIAANNLLDAIEKELLKRQLNPESYEKFHSKKKRNTIYYRIRVRNYLIFYTVQDNEMVVRRILYSRRNFDNIL